MKPSHITTPRTLADCNFQSWADHIEPWRNKAASWTRERTFCWAVACIGIAGFLFSLGS